MPFRKLRRTVSALFNAKNGKKPAGFPVLKSVGLLDLAVTDPARKSNRIRRAPRPSGVLQDEWLPEAFRNWETRAPLAILDAGMQIRDANSSFLDLLGIRAETALGRGLCELVAPSHRRELQEALENLRSGKMARLRKDLPLDHPGSDAHWVDTWISPIRMADGASAGYLLQATCIRPRKIMEHHLRQLNLQLQKHVELREAELRCAYEVLERENELRKEVEGRLLEVAEEEKNRLGQELHDGLGQELAGVALLGKSIAKRLAAEGHPTHPQLEKLSEYALQSIESARQIARGLFPVQLLRNGLCAALRELSEQACIRFRIECEAALEVGLTGLPKETELHAYRIAQESLHNAVRHGKATRIRVETALHGPHFLLSVSDNGSGFRGSEEQPAGMGLQLMAHRARITGGQLQLKESDSGGVCVRCRWPVQAPVALRA